MAKSRDQKSETMHTESSSGQWQEPPDDQACERVALLITRQIDGELATEDARDLRRHLAECSACRHALDAQSKQSKLLSKSLSALWRMEDRSALKKKALATADVQRSSHRISKLLTCAALAACVLFFAATVRAPSIAPIQDVSANRSFQTPAQAPTLEQVLVKSDVPTPSEKASPDKFPDEVTDDESIPDGSFETEAIAEIPRKSNEPETPQAPIPVARVEIANPPEALAPQPLASLAPSAPMKQLPTVSLSYSALTQSGNLAAGRVTLFGDVLNEKGCVRIETSRGEIVQAAQSEIDTALEEPMRSAARKLLNACTDAPHRERIKRALQELND